MADDIVEHLNTSPYWGYKDLELHRDAAAEIERLRRENALLASFLYPDGMMLRPTALPAEIERLRAAGDALADGIRTGHWDDALDAWEEVRNG